MNDTARTPPGVTRRRGHVAHALWSAALAFSALGCGPPDPPIAGAHAAPHEQTPTTQPAAPIQAEGDRAASGGGLVPAGLRLTAVGAEAGIEFVYHGGPSAARHMTEQNGGGVAVLDFDSDGRDDLFFANGSAFDPPRDAAARHALYWNRGDDSRMRFTDVARSAGVAAQGAGMGCAGGDFDNDGFEDLFVAGYRRHWLFRNNGDGSFTDVSGELPAAGKFWSTSATFADFDADGAPDLVLANYVDWSPDDPPCFSQHRPMPVRISCGPIGRTGQPCRLFINRQNGRFDERSAEAGFSSLAGKALDVVAADFDGNGWLDAYVANDTVENFLFLNAGRGRFDEQGVPRGVALNQQGQASSGMGIAVGDVDGDGGWDLLVTNFEHEVNDLYVATGGGYFVARNSEWGLDAPSRGRLGFGAVFADFDGDRDPDLLVANGHIWDYRAVTAGALYAMPAQLFENTRGERLHDVSDAAGDYFRTLHLGRAVAVSDLDNDADPDLVVTHVEERAEILRNDSISQAPRVRLKLVGTRGARQPRGSRVEVTAGGKTAVHWVPAGGGFQASSVADLLIVAGAAGELERIRVHWGPGRIERWTGARIRSSAPGARLVLREGSGELEPEAPAAGTESDRP